ncbi:alpha/beta fold hydrolase [Aquirhabdus parva]|uniref:Alpha/beta fold hydrolase n=1 Tax=Aquirhabdus parva TaxID=2283318 RepID=A0A345P8R7_9GAMM|nr:alpha/beta fold hydrolase [Aquirhabdus parva]AXI03676.1 alpha/beta fold hydrolase [Aquirhabdus parva]
MAKSSNAKISQRISQFMHQGLTFDVVDSGPLDGEVVVLLHGFPSTKESWSEVSSLLNAAGYRTIAPDQRGYSPLARPQKRSDYRLDLLAADIEALIDQIAQPIHLVGHDWGAMVAWRVAQRHTHPIKTLTTVSVPHPGAYVRSMLSSNQLFKSYYMVLFQLPRVPEWLTMKTPTIKGLLKNSGMTPEQIQHFNHDIVDRGALTTAINWYRAMPFMNPKTMLTKVKIPTTHVWSEGDVALAKAGAELTHRFVDADYKLEILKNLSHWIPEEAPQVLATIIESRIHWNA